MQQRTHAVNAMDVESNIMASCISQIFEKKNLRILKKTKQMNGQSFFEIYNLHACILL